MKKRILATLLALVMVLALVSTATAVDTTYKTWSQGDPRWGSLSISSTGNGNSMASVGCYVTAVAKLLVHAGQQDPAKFTPKECLNGLLRYNMLDANGEMQGGNYNNGFLQEFGPQLKKVWTNGGTRSWSAAVSEISEYIGNRNYVIVLVDSQYGTSTHFMAVDSVSDDVYVMDNGGVIGLYREGPSRGYSEIKDIIRFEYSGPHPYPAIIGSTSTSTPAPTTQPGNGGKAKTQYRYHRYENADGSDYFVCAYLGLNYYPSMKLVYSDWVDAPYPEVKKGYVNYLEHPHQSGCERAGCLSTDPFEVHRHVAPDGKVWYYEETRTVAAEEEKPAPTSTPTSTPTPTPIPTPTATPSPTPTPMPTPSCANGHSYKVDGETDTTVYYVCVNCGDSYEEAKQQNKEQTEKPEAVQGLPLPTVQTYREGMFRDVSAEQWFSGSVADAYALGLMKGTGEGAFSPGNNMTLAEAVTLAARIHKLYRTGSDAFPSYDGGNWYDPYVDYAREEGIVNTHYNYARPATREEFVHILALALPKTELANIAGTVSFADNGDIVYHSDVALLSGAGVINGISENGRTYFKPAATITRAEVAAVVARMARPSSRIGK